MQTKLPKHNVVLLGIGHTNAHVLRMWRMKPIKDAQLICVSNHWKAAYSGMMPGVLAGQYETERMEIDLVRLCAASGARLIVDEVTGIDHERRSLVFRDRADIPFSVLSIGIGSIPSMSGVLCENDSLLPIKPMQTFLTRLETKLSSLAEEVTDRPIRLSIIGAGVGGTEITFCLGERLKKIFPQQSFELSLITSAEHVATGCIPAAIELVESELAARKIQAVTGRRVQTVGKSELTLSDGTKRDCDLAIWATSATAPPLLGQLGLETDERGFLHTRTDLGAIGQDDIFVVGDSGTIKETPTRKAGVYAVRQGPILWRNIQELIRARKSSEAKIQRYQPQTDFLTLLNLGDGTAIAQYKGRAFKGGWAWRLKDYIDSKFMRMYQDYKPMKMKWEPPDEETVMRCTGCGGKVGGSVLSRVLHRLDVPQNEHVIVGLDEPDDAAVVQSPGGRPMTVTADFFTAPVDDPYIVGRIAALNSASDVFAIGAKPLAALAIITIPFGTPRRQEQVLYETLAGSMHEFRQMDCSLVGGHTIEGPNLTVGYTVLADQGTDKPRMKSLVRPGDKLVLTKPLGSGILLAAHMQALCKADWMAELNETMLLSNQLAASLVDRFDIAGLTDVTGFGLAGHLIEMLKPSKLSAKLSMDATPLIAGTAEMLASGIESTLAPANKDNEAFVRCPESLRSRPEFTALFDPQTCGGLLLGVAESEVPKLLRELQSQSNITAAVIGEVVAGTGQTQIEIVA